MPTYQAHADSAHAGLQPDYGEDDIYADEPRAPAAGGTSYEQQRAAHAPGNQPSYAQQASSKSPQVDVKPEDTDKVTPKSDPSGVKPGLSVAFTHDFPIGGKIPLNYATVQNAVQVGVKGSFKPDDAAWNPSVGWEGGIKSELLAKDWDIDKKAQGFGVKTVELKGTTHTPVGNDDEKDTWLNVAAELKVCRANGTFHQVNVVLAKAQRKGGEWDLTGPEVEVLPVGLDVLTQPIPVTKPVVGQVEGEFSVASKVTISPNWAVIMGHVAGNAAAAAEVGIALNSIGILEIGAITAPIAFAAVSIWSILDLDDAVTRRDTLGRDFRTALRGLRSGMKAGLTGGAAGKSSAAATGLSEGKKRYQAGWIAFKKKAQPWVKAQRAANKSEADIDAELKQAYDAKLAKVADRVVQRATASLDAGLREEMLRKYLEDHGDEWFAKPGLCFSVFKQLYPSGVEQPWTVPQALYERVRSTCKGHVKMPKWHAKPATKKETSEAKADKEARAKHKGGLSMDFIAWCRNYLTYTEAFQVSQVEMAYLEAYPDHTIDDSARASLQHLIDQFIRHPEWRRTRKKPEKKPVPTARELDHTRKEVWKSMYRAQQAGKKRGMGGSGKTWFDKGMTLRTTFVASSDWEIGMAAVQNFNMAANAWGVSYGKM